MVEHRRITHLIQGEFPIVVCDADNEDWPCAAERERTSQGHDTGDAS